MKCTGSVRGLCTREDPEVIALQEQLRQNRRADSVKTAASRETEDDKSPAEKGNAGEERA